MHHLKCFLQTPQIPGHEQLEKNANFRQQIDIIKSFILPFSYSKNTFAKIYLLLWHFSKKREKKTH